MHYILEGKRVVECHDLVEWARRFGDSEARRVAEDHLSLNVYVSTVFLGLDHGFQDGPPLLFETMVFGGPLDQAQWRYSTWEEAEAGHAEAVAMAKAVVSN